MCAIPITCAGSFPFNLRNSPFLEALEETQGSHPGEFGFQWELGLSGEPGAQIRGSFSFRHVLVLPLVTDSVGL